jgi:hypothetical protein
MSTTDTITIAERIGIALDELDKLIAEAKQQGRSGDLALAMITAWATLHSPAKSRQSGGPAKPQTGPTTGDEDRRR